MTPTAAQWRDWPADEWVTWVEPDKIASPHPGYCFKQAGWTLDRAWSHPRLLRLRAQVTEPAP